jgi:acetyltransferase (GNAT) family protein
VDDADRVVRFLSRRGAELKADDLRRWWTAPATELAEDTRIAEASGGELVGYGIVHPHDREYARIDLNAWVDPVGGGRPAATGLLAALVLRADRLAGRAPAGTPVVLRGRIEVPEGGESLLEEHGLAATGGAFRVTIAFIDPPPEPAWPEGLVLSPFRPGVDERAVYDVFAESFADNPGFETEPFEEWVETIRDPGFDPNLCLVVRAGEEVAAFSLSKLQRADPAVGWILSLGVGHRWRRRGLGLTLTRQTFLELYRRGARQVSGAVDFGLESTSLQMDFRLGMHIAERVVTFERSLRRGRPIVRGAARAARHLRHRR